MPWGAPNVAKGRRPQPHRIGSFDDPEKQGAQITTLLLGSLKEKIEALEAENAEGDGPATKTAYGQLLDTFSSLQRLIVAQAKDDIEAVETQLTTFIGNVFHGYRVQFDANPDDDLKGAAFNVFKTGAALRMGPAGGHMATAGEQGSGARRALMWAALQYISEAESKKKTSGARPHLLLLDEPELCLHPSAIRNACRLLYDLPRGGNWQVMVTTHSPAFVDLSRDNTTIVRVGRTSDGAIETTTVFRPTKVRLDEDDKAELKLLNLYDPYVAEFFFGGKIVLVEGDTEYTAFKHVLATYPDEPNFKDVHIIRARGKVTIALLARILNAFASPYAILHDSDAPTCIRKGEEINNPAWTNNGKILAAVQEAAGATRLVSLVPGFEAVFFDQEANGEKPYNALRTLQSDEQARVRVTALLHALVDYTAPLPTGCIQWGDDAALRAAHAKVAAG